jgi:hypothetical protein
MDPQANKEVVNEVVEQDTMHDAISAAIDKHAEADPKGPDAAASKPVASDKSADTPVSKPVAADKPVDKPVAASEKAVVDNTPQPDTAETASEGEDKSVVEARPDPLERAPISWKPAMREQWAALPKEVRQEIYRRERDISKGLSESAEARRFHQEFSKVARPYEHLIRMEAGGPIEGFENYLKTAAVLRQGTDWEKASSIAGVIKQFGISPEMLDRALVGVMPSPQERQQQPMRDPRLDELLGSLKAQQAQDEERVKQEALAELQQFRENAPEFLPDVETLMADILSVAAQNKQNMSLQQAYDRAIMIHPEVSEIVIKRRESGVVVKQGDIVAQARKKAVTGGNPPRIGNRPPPGDSVRSAVEDAIDRLSSM